MKANLILVILSFCTVSAVASEQSERLDARLRIAEQLSSLTAEESTPFHLKLTSTEIRHGDPEGNTEIEVWWANADRWRREVKSPAFSQTAIQDGTRYYESNGGEYLPWWLDQLIRKSVDPIPAGEVTGANDPEVEFADGNCARWQSHYAKGPAQIEITNTICFNPDGTLRELFTRTAGVQFSDYRYFGDKRIARILTVRPQPAAEVKATINILEALQENTEMFAIPSDTHFNARTRFVSVPEGALQVDGASQSSINWPVVHNFPASGAVTIDLTLDRAGNVREMGTVVSRNILMKDPAVEAVKHWKFRPYLQNGAPVQCIQILPCAITLE